MNLASPPSRSCWPRCVSPGRRGLRCASHAPSLFRCFRRASLDESRLASAEHPAGCRGQLRNRRARSVQLHAEATGAAHRLVREPEPRPASRPPFETPAPAVRRMRAPPERLLGGPRSGRAASVGRSAAATRAFGAIAGEGRRRDPSSSSGASGFPGWPSGHLKRDPSAIAERARPSMQDPSALHDDRRCTLVLWRDRVPACDRPPAVTDERVLVNGCDVHAMPVRGAIFEPGRAGARAGR